ncbi:MBL fold metallo-hydrolase [Acetobacter musti]|uniref:MBL fold metallo-hydrolase n=1 Tax=Acetobacter musti TaxID=864732 RepID=A0ABX0JMR3_9PROT|nr:MBL fold metallo-hydrolase [Acetobacter musti]NHN84049.1 MBL fold metallo-hydrolase [Acetobacter musti]
MKTPPEYGQALTEAPGLRRIVARNPGPMTYHGTNTWLIETGPGWLVVDPGPDDPDHHKAVLDACAGKIHTILVTHSHHDHEAGAQTLARLADAPLWGGTHGQNPDTLTIPGLRLVRTPGHTMDHVCVDIGEGRLLTGDHIMGWSTSVILRAPHGSMSAYLTSLKDVRARSDATLFSAHGPAITEPESFLSGLLHTRLRKIAQTRDALTASPQTESELLTTLYKNLPQNLTRAASEMLGSMLEYLEAQEEAVHDGKRGWRKN